MGREAGDQSWGLLEATSYEDRIKEIGLFDENKGNLSEF